MLNLRFFALACICLPASLGYAQTLDLERFTPALDAEGFIGVQGTRTPGPGRETLALFTHYSRSVLRVDAANGQQVDAISDRLAGSLAAELGIGPRAALAFSVPIVIYQVGDARASSTPLPAFAAGDPSVALRYRFFGHVGTGMLRKDDGPGFALQVGAMLPAGFEDAYAGEGAVRTDVQLLADYHVSDSAGIGTSLGWRHRFEARSVLDVRLRDEFTFGVGLKLPVVPLYPLEGLLEVRGATDFSKAVTTALEIDLGARYPLGKGWTLQLAAGPGLTRGVGTPAIRVMAGLFYVPGGPDSDEDGIPDAQDACPPLPEDRDGFQDSDGCPDPDNDNDLVPDADDLCPNQQAEEDRDQNEDGCTD